MLKSLPTTVATSNLDAMLAAIEKLPSAVIKRSESMVTVHATSKKTGEITKVLSALSTDGRRWAVRAVPGLFTMA